VFLECDVSSSPREIDLEEIRTYVPLMTHVDFVPTTTNAPHVDNAPLVENANSSAKNVVMEPAINEQEGLEENEMLPTNDHEEEPQ
jgi:hypothetical protein